MEQTAKEAKARALHGPDDEASIQEAIELLARCFRNEPAIVARSKVTRVRSLSATCPDFHTNRIRGAPVGLSDCAPND